MHTGPMSETQGELSEEKIPATGVSCRKCKGGPVVEQEWTSSCGGYEDYKYTCQACGFVWWVDGIDS